MTPRGKQELFKWIVYTLLATILLAIQTTPNLLAIFSIRPDFLLSFCVFLAVFETPLKSAYFGMLIGLMLDFSRQTAVGFYGILCMLTAAAISWVIKKFFSIQIKNAILFYLIAMIGIGVLGFLFEYIIWYQGAIKLLDITWVLQNLYSILVAPFVYYMVQFLDRTLNRRRG